MKKKKNKENYSTNERGIKIGLIVVIALFVFIVYKIFNVLVLDIENINLSGEKYYQYFSGIKQEYTEKTELMQTKDETKLILENGETVYLDSTPIYYENKLGKALFASEMAFIIPNTGNYKLPKFTNVIEENTILYLKKHNKKDKKAIGSAFIFDGEDLYFFLEPTKIQIGDNEFEVSPLSYAIVNYKQNVEIYDYQKDEYTIISNEEDLQADILASNRLNTYTINMSLDSLSTNTSKQLLIKSIDKLEELTIK